MSVRPVPGFPGYSADESGAVYGISGKRLSPNAHSGGYHIYHLRRAGRRHAVYAHRLVLSAFVGEPPSPSHVANHKNFDRTDNRPCNLEWVTQRDNILHAHAAGHIPAHSIITHHRPQIRRMILDGWRTADIAKHFGCWETTIGKVLREMMTPEQIKKRALSLRRGRVRDSLGRFTGQEL